MIWSPVYRLPRVLEGARVASIACCFLLTEVPMLKVSESLSSLRGYLTFGAKVYISLVASICFQSEWHQSSIEQARIVLLFNFTYQ